MGALYEPLNTLKPVGPDIWIVDGPPVSFYGIGFPTRMTVVRIDGRLWLHSPIALDEALLAALAELGEVGWLIAPNPIHYVSLGGWATRFPRAHVWAAPGVAARARKFKVKFPPHQVLSDTASPDWDGVIRQRIVAGHRFLHEVVFFHLPSRVLILTDLIENFEPARVGPVRAFMFRLAGNLDPDGKAPVDMRMSFRDKSAARAVIREVISWAPDKVIVAHGRCYDENAVAELERAFRWLNP